MDDELIDDVPEVDFEAGQAELDALEQRARDYAEQAERQAAGDFGTDIAIVDASPVERRELLVSKRAEIERTRQALAAQTEALERQLKTEMERMDALMRPLQEQAKILGQGIQMIEGYLGVGEDIESLRDGAPAAADETIWVRQLVLGMDEECAITDYDMDPKMAKEFRDGIDSSTIWVFIEWLLADERHVDQLVPEQKCVVALRPRRNPKPYGEEFQSWDALMRMMGDTETYLLIRNGENLYLYTPKNFDAGKLLVPDPSEIEALYTREEYDPTAGRTRRVKIEPGSFHWDKAEKEADAYRRYYMRGALVLEGLLHRTAVFHPVPDGASFIQTESYESGATGVVLDGINTLASGQETWKEYQRRLIADLRKGMRVLVRVHNKGRYQSDDRWYSWDVDRGQGYIFSPERAEDPPSGPLAIDEMDKFGNPIIRYARTEQIWVEPRDRWGRAEYRTPKTRASVRVGRFTSTLIPLDLMDLPTIERFINSRAERANYADIMPLLKEARKVLIAEAEAEAPFRLMMTGILAKDNNVDIATVEADLDDLIEWFKHGRVDYRPIAFDATDEDEKIAQWQAIEALSNEYTRRLADRAKPVKQALVDRLAAIPGTLLVARKRDGKYVHVAPTDGSDVYVTITEYGARGAVSGEPREWVIIGRRTKQWQVLWTAPAYDSWPIFASPSRTPTGPQMAEALALIEADEDVMEADDRHGPACAVVYDHKTNQFVVWHVLHTFNGRADAITGYQNYDWRNTADGIVVERAGRSNSSAWDPGVWRDPNYRAVYGDRDHRRTILREWPEAIAAADKIAAEVREREAISAKKRNQWWRDHAAVVGPTAKAWLEAAEERRLAVFIEQYGDASLWEGHRKTLPKLSAPDINGIYHAAPNGLEDVAGKLVLEAAAEYGVELDDPETWEGVRFGEMPEPADDDDDDDDDFDDEEYD